MLKKAHDQSHFRDADYWQLDLAIDTLRDKCEYLTMDQWFRNPFATHCSAGPKFYVYVSPVGRRVHVKRTWYTRSTTLDKKCADIGVGFALIPPFSISAALFKPCWGGTRIDSGATSHGSYFTVTNFQNNEHFTLKSLFKTTKCIRPRFKIGTSVTAERTTVNHVRHWTDRTPTYVRSCRA
ncbi:MAG: hypothetical protein ACR2LE_03820 [Nocardioidaceae bacterium]